MSPHFKISPSSSHLQPLLRASTDTGLINSILWHNCRVIPQNGNNCKYAHARMHTHTQTNSYINITHVFTIYLRFNLPLLLSTKCCNKYSPRHVLCPITDKLTQACHSCAATSSTLPPFWAATVV